MNKEVDNVNYENGILRQQLTNERKKQESLVVQCDEKIKYLKTEVDEMKKKHERLIKKNEKHQMKMSDENKETIQKLRTKEAEVETINNVLIEVENKIFTYEEQIERYKKSLTKSEMENRKLKDTKRNLEEQVVLCQKNLSEEKTLFVELKRKTDQQISELEAKSNKYLLQAEGQEMKIGELETTLHQQKEQIKTFKSDIDTKAELTNKNSTLEKINKNLQDVLRFKDTKINHLQDENKNLKKQNERNAEKHLLPHELEYWETRVSSLEENVKVLTINLDTKISENQIANAQIDTLREENGCLQHLILLNENKTVSNRNTQGKVNTDLQQMVLETSLLGVTELENENDMLHNKIKEMQRDFMSSKGTIYDPTTDQKEPSDNTRVDRDTMSESGITKVSDIEGSVMSSLIGGTDESLLVGGCLKRSSYSSLVDEFVQQEVEREQALLLRLQSRVRDFDTKCKHIIKYELT